MFGYIVGSVVALLGLVALIYSFVDMSDISTYSSQVAASPNQAEIQAAIKETGVTVEKIWLTHGHIDHVGGAAELRDAVMELERLSDTRKIARLLSLPGAARGLGIPKRT